MSAEVQAAFNAKKGSLPVRNDVSVPNADICTERGMAAIRNPARRLTAPDQLLSPTQAGLVQDAISRFWNTGQSVDEAAKALGAALRQ